MKRNHLLPLFMLLAALLLPAALEAPSAAAAPATDAAAPNDQTQGRLRFDQCVDGVPPVAVYVNGQVPVNAGVPQNNLSNGTTGYLYLAPSTYHVALVPVGHGLDHPFLGPLDVQVAAGHRYTVVVLGQQEDPIHKALVIDETAAYQAIGAWPPDSQHIGHITVNNIKSAPPVHFILNGVAQERGVAYGSFEATLWPAFVQQFKLATSATPSVVLGQSSDSSYNPPGSDNLDCLFGTYPTNDTHTTASTSVLNPVDLLQSYSQLAATTSGQTPKFDTFLAALKTTGLTQMLKTGGPYLLFAPTDAAFAALPQDKLAALLADQKALAETLRSHVVVGYYPEGTLFPNGATDRTLTNILGAPLVMTRSGSGLDGLTINGQAVSAGDQVYVADGTRVIEINNLILPATKAANPAPVMPTTGAGRAGADLTLAIVAGLAVLLVGARLRGRMMHP